MKALVYSAPERFTLVDEPDPAPAAGEVRIAVERVGVCGTDLHVHHGTIPVAYPVIPGHEIVGTVDAVGPQVDAVSVGERVVVDPNVPCGVCAECRRVPSMQCLALRSFGVTAAGGLAEFLVVPATHAFPVGDMSVELAAFAEPVACVLAGVERIAPRLGDHALVLGAGPSGLMMAQALRIAGAASVTVAAPRGPKLERAALMGADAIDLLDRGDLDGSVDRLLSRAAGRGFDLVVDVTGSAQVGERTLRLVAPSGRVMLYGVVSPAETIRISPYDLYRRDLSIIGSFAQSHSLSAAIALLAAGRIDPRPLITHEFALSEWSAAVEALLTPGTVHKAVIDVRG